MMIWRYLIFYHGTHGIPIVIGNGILSHLTVAFVFYRFARNWKKISIFAQNLMAQ